MRHDVTPSIVVVDQADDRDGALDKALSARAAFTSTARTWRRWAWAAAVVSTVGFGCGDSTGENETTGGSGGAGGATTGGTGGSGANEAQGIPALGNGTHDLSNVAVEKVGTADNDLSTPRDLAFKPGVPGELWVANIGNNAVDQSMVVFQGLGTDAQTSQRYAGLGGTHFFAVPSSIAFGDNGFFASAHETDDKTQGENGTPADFMGPTLWTSDLSEYNAGHASHYDMLHNSPNGMGIAWEVANVYWVFDGYHSALTRYDFNDDHGPGGEDHSDAEVTRYVEGEVAMVDGVPSHMEYDPSSGLLYVADTGNNRVAVLDTTTGTPGSAITPNYDGGMQYAMDGATLTTLIDGAAEGMSLPSGLALHEGVLYVGDHADGTVYAFNLDGQLVDYLALPVDANCLMGLELDDQGNIYTLDSVLHEVLRVSPLAQ